MIRKSKVYVRRWVCINCKLPVIAIYNKNIKHWELKCKCGIDNTFLFKLNSKLWERLDKGNYPIDEEKERDLPPPQLTIMGKHIIDNPCGSYKMRCVICGKPYIWKNNVWREDI